MKKKTYASLFIVLCCILPMGLMAQFDDLKAQLKGKETFSEITATVEQYLAITPDSYEKSKFKKHFNRWAYYQSFHLGPNGEFVNVAKRTFEAVANKAEAPSRSWNGSWNFVGPSSTVIDNPGADLNGLGRVDRMAFHPTDATIIYVGTPSGGLWKTTNGGTSWTPISDFIPSLGISGIVVDHTDPNTLYVLTGDGDSFSYGGLTLVTKSGYGQYSIGVLVSYDGGTTWEQTGELFNGEYVGFRLVQHPTNSNILLAATSEGIYRTTNGGDTWIQERAGKHYDIEFKPGDPAKVYASGTGEFVYSINTGDTWNTNASFDYPLCDTNRIEIAVTPYNANKVFLLAAPAQSGNKFCGFYQSSNSGLNFYRWSNSPNVLGMENGSGDQSDYDMGLAVSPYDDQSVIAAGLIIFKSTNGGSTFSNATIYRENGVDEYIHPDIHSVEYNPLNGYLYAAGDGGFHRSVNDGTNWTDLYNGIETSQFYHMDDYDANQYAMFAGCQDNGLKYKTVSGSAFSHIYCCDGFDVAINYNDQTKGYGVINGGLLRYTDFTGTAPITINNTGWFKQIELHSSDPTILYYSNSRIWEYDADFSTHTILGGANISGWWALKTCPSNAARIYAAGSDSLFDKEGEMFMSANNGSTWSTISDNPGFPTTFNRISDIGVRPNSSQSVYACFSGYTDNLKVYYSYDWGANWTNISYDLPNIPVWSIEVDASNNVYIGTDYGVFYKGSGETNWEPYYNGLPNVPVSDLAINEGSDQLLASTFGRGIWKSTLRDPCPADRTITINLQGQNFRSASNSIKMSGDIVGGEGTSVALRAGNYVDLQPGFIADAEPGNKFLAYVGDCEGGIPPEFSFGNPADTTNLSDDFSFSVARNLGTLEIIDVSTTEKKVIVRLFKDRTSSIKVFLTNENGRFIRDIADFKGQKGKTEYTFQIADLKPGMYFLYLGVDSDVNHLQEMYIPKKEVETRPF